MTHQDFARELGVQSLEELARFPKYLQIETISGCNARCVMCSVESWTRGKAVMSDRLFGKIVDEVRGHSDWIERVIVQLDGEPLLDKRLERRIAALKSAGMRKVSFATNGSLMTEARAASIIDAGVDSIDFSIDGATAETFEAIRLRLSFATVQWATASSLRHHDSRRRECGLVRASTCHPRTVQLLRPGFCSHRRCGQLRNWRLRAREREQKRPVSLCV